MLSSLYATFEN
ncbi:Protein of unknown function [Bacillus mycoides]|nr:Protein of unknown function [Bacillus mycoides]